MNDLPHATGDGGVLPDFLIAGAAKGGTSWLALCLKEHPEVFVPSGESLDFFSRNYEKGFSWYESFFSRYSGEKAVGETSTSYMTTPGVPERIHSWNPGVRLLFLLRNPVERAYSHYCMRLRSGLLSDDVDLELSPESGYVTAGLYRRHMRRFEEFFPKEQIKVLIHDDLKKDPLSFLQSVFAFLGVDPLFQPEILDKPYHVRKSRPRFLRLYTGLVAASAWVSNRSTYGRDLIEGARKRRTFDFVHRLNRGPDFPVFPKETKRRLGEFYRQDVADLSAWMGRDLSSWLATSEDDRDSA